ncbi:hypothetical protein LLG90_22195 [Aromatoleum toluclasticum]|uniref:hypothetical protein n=1 Tax=Aromatoleum toluclasticum TaxID=92003 RepID=UPI0003747B62|nr:hypothetical protein [Aromatoleum toluclasticum]MCC4118069.1 hypothetical protein [Aromatoleum toluclasticum]
MMFADLVDVDDFRQRLGELGIDLPVGGSPDDWAGLVRAAQPVDGLPELIGILCAEGVTLQPEVRQTVDIILMP